jgi:hypothetical protein
VREFVGFNPDRHLRDDGSFATSFELENIIRIELPLTMKWTHYTVRRMATHRKVAVYLESALNEVAHAGLWPFIQDYGGGFVPRLIRGGTAWSMHSFGLAQDFDPKRNPLGAPPSDCHLGNTGEGLAVVRIFTSWGFLWGGYFDGRKDCQHFQWNTGC